MTLKVARGGTIRLFGHYRDGSGQLVHPTNARLDILDPNDVQIAADIVPDEQSLGTFFHDFTVAVDAALGIWTAHWKGAISSVDVTGDDPFEVLAAGSVGFVTPAFATIEEFEERKGSVDADDERASVEALLTDATALILSEVEGSKETWVATPSSSVAPAAIKSICIEAAYRAWSNPDGVSSAMMGASTIAYPHAVPDVLFVTDAERRTIRRQAKLSSGNSVTLVTPYSGDDATTGDLL